MKQKICIAITLLLITSNYVLYAQNEFTTKGQKVLSANGNIYSEQGETTNNTATQSQDFFTYGLNLSYGKFYKKNVLSSVTIGFSRINIERNSLGVTLKEPRTFYNAGISQTYYTTLGKKFFFGIGAVLSGNYGKAQYSNGVGNNGINKYYVLNFSIVPSLAYQLNKRLVGNLSTGNNFLGINYVNSKTTETTPSGQVKTSNTNLGLNAGFTGSTLSNLNIGFSYLLK